MAVKIQVLDIFTVCYTVLIHSEWNSKYTHNTLLTDYYISSDVSSMTLLINVIGFNFKKTM